jgi:uncharacterized protein YggE
MTDAVIRVRGRGELDASPDLVVLVFQVRGRATEYATAIARAAVQVEGLRASLEAQGVRAAALKTTGFAVDTEYDRDSEERTLVGYMASHSLRLELSRDADAGAVLDTVAEAAPGVELRVSFEIVDRRGFRQRLLAAAVEDARRNAETIAEAAGVRLGSIASIEYGPTEVRFASPFVYDAVARLGAPASTSFEPADVRGEESVTVAWTIAHDGCPDQEHFQ